MNKVIIFVTEKMNQEECRGNTLKTALAVMKGMGNVLCDIIRNWNFGEEVNQCLWR